MNNFLTLSTENGGGQMILILVVYAVFIGVMWLVWIRPNNKKKKKDTLKMMIKMKLKSVDYLY